MSCKSDLSIPRLLTIIPPKVLQQDPLGKYPHGNDKSGNGQAYCLREDVPMTEGDMSRKVGLNARWWRYRRKIPSVKPRGSRGTGHCANRTTQFPEDRSQAEDSDKCRERYRIRKGKNNTSKRTVTLTSTDDLNPGRVGPTSDLLCGAFCVCNQEISKVEWMISDCFSGTPWYSSFKVPP